MCGHNLRVQPKRPQRVAWVDILLVLAVVAVKVNGGGWAVILSPKLLGKSRPEAFYQTVSR